jgi:ABC-type transport system involved in multi-copper enzyme maturation permease subunit
VDRKKGTVNKMINMIKADCYRMLHSAPIYIAFGVMLMMMGIGVYMMEPGAIGLVLTETSAEEVAVATDETASNAQGVLDSSSIGEYRKAMKKSSTYKLDKDILAQNMNLYYIFIFVAALAVAVDFSGGSIKNTLSSAISRKKYFVSKSVFITLFCLVMFFANTYITYFANRLFNGANMSSGLASVTKISLLQLPAVLALSSLLTGIAFLTKKTSIFNTITIPFIMLFQILLNVARSLFQIKEKYLQYELQIMIGKLADDPANSYLIHSYLFCGIIIVVFLTAGWASFRKTEIK